MKKRYRIALVMLCMIMCICGCSSGTDTNREEKTAETDKRNEEAEVNSKEKKEKAYQKKLDMIEPSAYDNVMGLNLKKGSSISVIGKAENVPYWDEVKKGAEQAVKDINENLGYEGKAQVKMTYSAPATPDDVDEQVNILDEELARYPEAVAIAIADVKSCEVQFDLAAESDIPVVAFDSGNDYQGLMASVSTDNRASAQEAAQKLAGLMDEKGEVILFIQDSKSQSANDRENAFKEEIENNYPEISVVETYHMDQLSVMQEMIAAERNGRPWKEGEDQETKPEEAEPALPDQEQSGTSETEETGQAGSGESEQEQAGDGENQSPEQGQSGEEDQEEVTADMISEEEVLDYILEKHPDAAGIYATSGDAVQLALDTLERNKKKAHVVGYDGNSNELEALKEGKIDALVLQNPFGMGYAAVIASARAALSMGNEAVVDTGYTWLTKKNLEDENIQKLLYN